MSGTLAQWAAQPDVEICEFTLTSSYAAHDGQRVEVEWASAADRRGRLARPALRYADLASLRRAWRDVMNRIEQWGPDVVFANPCSNPGGAPPGLGRLTAPIVYYCDEPRRVDYERAAASQSNPWTRLPYLPMRRVHRRDERASVAAARFVLTNSPFTARRIFDAYGVHAEVCSPGIDNVFTPARAETVGHVLSVGTLIPSKGHDLAIEAVAKSETDAPVVVVSPIDLEPERTRLEALATSVGVELRVVHGIDDATLVDLYRGAVATVYLAREEPLGLVSLESQACGTPVIVSAEGGLPDTVDDGVTGWAVARTVDGAAEALRRLQDDETRARMRSAAAARDIPRVDGSARRVRELLDEAVAGG